MDALPDAAMVRRGLRALGEELAFAHCDLGRWAATRGTAAPALRTALIVHIRDRAAQQTRTRTTRRFAIVAACDLDGSSHKRAAADFGLSRAQFYRERRLAVDELRAVAIEAVSVTQTSAIVEPFRSIVSGAIDRERAFRELREVAAMLVGARGNGIAARLAREASNAAAAFEEQFEGADGPIAV